MDTLWKKCLEEIEEKILPESFSTWFAPTYPVSKNDGSLTIEVPNSFFEKCLIENYLNLIEDTLENITQEKMAVRFAVRNESSAKQDKLFVGHKETLSQPLTRESAITTGAGRDRESFLNTKYNFSNFIVGSSNQFARAACEAVANAPAQNYNPLFVYGGVGLGKTHLLHAIGNLIVQNNRNLKVRYISAESFTVDMIESIKKDRMQAFRQRYRPLDVLLVDDIQFLAGKERTQEEFFYTFNSLYEYHKQIVISSDRYPKDMLNIEERLRSRFESGLITDIMPPDLETKVAILYKKAEVHKKEIPPDVAIFIASNIKTNIRELEGFLLRIIAYASFAGRAIDLELAKEVLKDFTVDKNRNFTVPNIMKTTAAYFDLKVSDLKSKKRTRNISIPRQIAMFLCREYTQASLPEIGKQFGGKDHTTVIFAHKKMSTKTKQNKELEKATQEIIKKIENT